jgi:multiple antibiotic resistance protein
MDPWNSLFLVFVSIFVALDIVGTLPMFLSLTRTLSDQERKHICNQSMLTALVVALIFVFLGKFIFRFLGIELFDFKMAGGIVLLLVALSDLALGPESKQQSTGSTGIVPLAVPLITGPGVLTTLILQVGVHGYAICIAALLLNYAIAWGLLRKSEKITDWIGKDGTVIVSKIAALLLAAISVGMIRSGVFEAIKNGSI